MTVNETNRTLYLLRHAKAKVPQPGQPDAARELTGRGRRAAAALGSRFAAPGAGRTGAPAGPSTGPKATPQGGGFEALGPLPELVVTSPAARAAATAAEWARAAGFPEDRIIRDERIYAARVGTLLTLIHELDASLRSVLLVGHDPAFSELAGQLAGRYLALRTCAVAVFRIGGPWAGTSAADARLLRLERPG